jgi:hypothetical protein
VPVAASAFDEVACVNRCWFRELVAFRGFSHA